MQFEEYITHYKAFHKEFSPLAGIAEIEFKAACECREFIKAYEQGCHDDLKIDEAIDGMNTLIMFLYSHGVVNPLFAGYQKLQHNANLYRTGAKDPLKDFKEVQPRLV